MIKKLSAIAGLFLLVATVSCSSDSPVSEEKEDTQSISNNEITLQYGGSILTQSMEIKNNPLQFTKIDGTVIKSGASSSKTVTYSPNLAGAIAATGSNWYNINNGETYYIPEGSTFSGGFNFNSAGKIIVLGTLGGSNWINVPNGGRVEVGNNGKILSSANFHLNSGGRLDNYGSVEYSTSSVDGVINNYNNLTFKADTSLNGSSTVNNYCKMLFEKQYNYINSQLNNSAYLTFAKGFHINGSGRLNLEPQSFTEVNAGSISIDGKINNSGNGFARIDFLNTSITNINASPAVTGLIDMNFTNTPYTIFQSNNRINSQVTLNANAYIPAGECTPQKGSSPCTDSQLQFSLVANVINPVLNNSTLSATGVVVNNGFAYLSYHSNDEVSNVNTQGALRIIDVTNYNAPSLISQALFNNIEFNHVDVSDSKIYASGGDKNGAKLVVQQLVNNVFNTQDLSQFNTYKLPSSTAKNSYFLNNAVYAVTGATGGGLFKLDPSSNYNVNSILSPAGEKSKFVVHNANYQVFFSTGDNGATLRIADLNGVSAQTYNYPALKQLITNGKNAMTIDEEYVYVALSDRGVAKIKLSNGQLISTFEPRSFKLNGQNIFSKTGLTNAVAINNCYLYLANGTDGVIVLNKNSFNVVGYLKLGGSANYIYTNNNLMYVSTGKSGLNIIKVN